MSEQLPPLPDPYSYVYEWDGPYGTRKFSSNFWNGREADRAVAIFSADQMKAYARAAVEAEREACAKMCEDRAGTASMFATVAEARSHGATVRGCAAAIRARGKS